MNCAPTWPPPFAGTQHLETEALGLRLPAVEGGAVDRVQPAGGSHAADLTGAGEHT